MRPAAGAAGAPEPDQKHTAMIQKLQQAKADDACAPIEEKHSPPTAFGRKQIEGNRDWPSGFAPTDKEVYYAPGKAGEGVRGQDTPAGRSSPGQHGSERREWSRRSMKPQKTPAEYAHRARQAGG